MHSLMRDYDSENYVHVHFLLFFGVYFANDLPIVIRGINVLTVALIQFTIQLLCTHFTLVFFFLYLSIILAAFHASFLRQQFDSDV